MQTKRIFSEYKKQIAYFGLIVLALVQISCSKYLDKKPVQNITIPKTTADLQALLDNESFNGVSPGDLEFVADNYYLTNQSWTTSASNAERLAYIWDGNAQPTSLNIWFAPYNSIYQTNFVLDQLPKIDVSDLDKDAYNNVKGTALFYRSFLFYQLAQLYCRPYSSSAAIDPGIVLRMTPDVNIRSTRSTVEQTYNQILTDLKTAASILPTTALFFTRPNKAAAYGTLARVYLSMSNYDSAGRYADLCLNIKDTLLNYNNSNLPAVISNPEILYLSFEAFAPNYLLSTRLELIDSSLYQSYDVNDLRKTMFFGSAGAGTYYWKGSYNTFSTDPSIFDGLATDEIYLIRAECRAKALNVTGAMDDLNKLLRNRWKLNTFSDLVATDATDALNKIRIERRKELLFRGLRWSDLRRFNLEGVNITTLKRIVNGTTYTLPPNDLRWVLLIPDIEITRSGIAQNPR